MKYLNIYYIKKGRIYLVQNHYHKSLKVIKETLKYAKYLELFPNGYVMKWVGFWMNNPEVVALEDKTNHFGLYIDNQPT